MLGTGCDVTVVAIVGRLLLSSSLVASTVAQTETRELGRTSDVPRT